MKREKERIEERWEEKSSGEGDGRERERGERRNEIREEKKEMRRKRREKKAMRPGRILWEKKRKNEKVEVKEEEEVGATIEVDHTSTNCYRVAHSDYSRR